MSDDVIALGKSHALTTRRQTSFSDAESLTTRCQINIDDTLAQLAAGTWRAHSARSWQCLLLSPK